MKQALGFSMVLCASALLACSKGPEGAPPSARQAVDPSAEGLYSLFVRECVEWRDFGWAQEESKRIVATCGGLLVGAGEQGDCEQSVAGDVAWLVPTTRKSTVLISLFWSDDPHRLSCSVSATPDLADAIGAVARRFAATQSLTPQPTTDKAEEAYWRGAAGQLSLRRHDLNEQPDIRMDTEGQWGARGVGLQRRHPLELHYLAPPR